MMDKQRPLSYPELEKEREISLVLKSYETLLANALTEYPAVEDIPEEAKRKIHNRLYAEARRSQALRRAKRVGNAAAVFLLIFLLSAAILCVSVAGIRESITDFWMEHTGYMALELPGSRIYVEQWEGYEYLGGWMEGSAKASRLGNAQGQEVIVLSQPVDSIGLLDTENATVNERVAITEGVEGIYIEKADDDGNDVHILWWADDAYAYHITGNFSREGMVALARDICGA